MRIRVHAASLAIALSGFVMTPSLQAQALPGKVSQLEIDTGGKKAFDVASVKPNKSGSQLSDLNIPIGPGDAYTPTGGLYSGTNIPLISYIYFAYKLTGNQFMFLLEQLPKLVATEQLPKWVTMGRFDIQARAEGNPSKDQMRLMLQSLLEDRFKLAVHYETRQLPVLSAVLVKPGMTGPQLQPHSDETPCPDVPVSPTAAQPPTVTGGYPVSCGRIAGMPPSVPGRMNVGARNVPIGVIMTTLAQIGGLDRSVLDQTDLSGNFDFRIEFVNQRTTPTADLQPADDSGPTFLQAIKEQLGLKLESTTGPIEVFVVDHIEQPSEN